jgi:hypothetical protein
MTPFTEDTTDELVRALDDLDPRILTGSYSTGPMKASMDLPGGGTNFAWSSNGIPIPASTISTATASSNGLRGETDCMATANDQTPWMVPPASSTGTAPQICGGNHARVPKTSKPVHYRSLASLRKASTT